MPGPPSLLRRWLFAQAGRPSRTLALRGRLALLASAGIPFSSTCSEPPVATRPFAPFDAVQPIGADGDPFRSHRPTVVDCNPLSGWFSEENGGEVELEIDTGHCNYAALAQATTSDVAVGEHITGTLSFFELTSPLPARAHFALQAGDLVLFSREFEIPGPADVIDIDVVAPQFISAGTPLVVHLHNHGQNTWNLSPLFVGPSEQ